MSERDLRPISVQELRAVYGLYPLSKIKDTKRRGWCSQLRGDTAESRALRAAEGLVHQIPWVHEVRKGTPSEDSEAKDIVIRTDFGEVFVQVKASRGQAKRFRRQITTPYSKRGWLHGCCIVIVAGPAIPIEKIMLETLIGLVRLRAGLPK